MGGGVHIRVHTNTPWCARQWQRVLYWPESQPRNLARGRGIILARGRGPKFEGPLSLLWTHILWPGGVTPFMWPSRQTTSNTLFLSITRSRPVTVLYYSRAYKDRNLSPRFTSKLICLKLEPTEMWVGSVIILDKIVPEPPTKKLLDNICNGRHLFREITVDTQYLFCLQKFLLWGRTPDLATCRTGCTQELDKINRKLQSHFQNYRCWVIFRWNSKHWNLSVLHWLFFGHICMYLIVLGQLGVYSARSGTDRWK